MPGTITSVPSLIASTSTADYVFALLFLVLAAQYESFILPWAVLLSLPIGVFGSFLLLQGMGLANDIYAQLGLVMLVGLLGKNAVLIVEFAVQKHHQGATVLAAATEGAKVRFRPILMTSFAFIAGLVPLVRATGGRPGLRCRSEAPRRTISPAIYPHVAG